MKTKTNDGSMYTPPANTASAAPVDRNWRCDLCYMPGDFHGLQKLGSLLFVENIMVKVEPDKPSVMIGRVMRCSNPFCKKPPVVKFFKGAKALDIEPANIYSLLRQSFGIPRYTLAEVYSGKLETFPIPESISALFRPTFGAEPEPVAPVDPSLFAEEVTF